MGAAHAFDLRHVPAQSAGVEKQKVTPPAQNEGRPISDRTIVGRLFGAALSRHRVSQTQLEAKSGRDQRKISKLILDAISGVASIPLDLLLSLPDAAYRDVIQELEVERARRRSGGPPTRGQEIEDGLVECLQEITAAFDAHRQLHPDELVKRVAALVLRAFRLLNGIDYLAPERKP